METNFALHARRMTGRRKMVIGLVGVAATLSLTACGAISGGSAPAASSSAQPLKSITFVNSLPSYPDFNVIGKCAAKEAKKLKVSYNSVGTTGTAVDSQASAEQVTQAVAAGSNGIIVVPLDTKVYTPAIQQARAKGAYVVAAGTGDPSTGQQSQAGTSGSQLGKLEADSLGAISPNAVVGFLSQSADQQIQVEAIDGFKKEAAAKFPTMKISAEQFDNGDSTKVVDIVSNMLAGNPNISALYVLNGPSLGPAATAVREAGKTGKILIIGHDVTDVSRPLITSGAIYGVAEQGWCQMGTKSVDSLYALSKGHKVPAFIPTELTFVTKANLSAN